MNWNLFVTELVAGIVHGSVYALIALGYSMVYGILKLLNFAHGDVYMVGAFIGYGVLTVFGGATALAIPIGLLLAAMFLAAMLGGGLLGVAIERFAYRRAARRAANRAADHRARRLVLPRERGAAARSAPTTGATTPSAGTTASSGRTGFTLPSGVHRRARADHRRRRDDRADDRAHLVRLADAARPGDARRRPSTAQAAEMMGIDVNRVIAVDVLHRLGARGRGRRLQLPRLPAGLALHGLRGRPEGASRPP